MKYFFSILCASLILTSNAWADEKASLSKASGELVKYVKKNLRKIERDGAREVGISSITIEKDSVECLGIGSATVEDVVVGTCLANGDLDYPNSESTFAITVSQDSRAETRSTTVQVLTTEDN